MISMTRIAVKTRRTAPNMTARVIVELDADGSAILLVNGEPVLACPSLDAILERAGLTLRDLEQRVA
jgi:hypothetical protein